MVRKLIVTRVSDESGIVVVIVAVFMVVALGFTALVVDLGNGRQQRRQAQATADAAALAGAQEFVGRPPNAATWTRVVDKVKRYAESNFGVDRNSGWIGCSDPGALAGYSRLQPEAQANTCISTNALDGSEEPIRVRVRVPTRTINTAFAGVLGVNTLRINASAEAKIESRTATVACAICALSGTTNLFEGGGAITAHNGDVLFNGALDNEGQTSVTADVGRLIGVHGDCLNCNASDFLPDWTTLSQNVPDPLASLPDPLAGQIPPNPTISPDGKTYAPGTYGNIILPTGNTQATFLPGLYHITGTLTGSFKGTGVMLYFSGTGKWWMQNTDRVDLSPPTQASCGGHPSCETYIGLNIFYSRSSTQDLVSCSSGGGVGCSPIVNITGTVYAINSTLVLNASFQGLVKSAFIVGLISTNGPNAGITVDFDPTTNVNPPSTQVVDAAPNLYR